MAKLITEDLYSNLEILIEQKNPDSYKTIYIQGPYIIASVKNANGRIYDEGLMNRVVEEYGNKYIKMNRAYGELNHPTHTEVDPKQACDRCVSLLKDKNTWIGKSIILSSDPSNGIHGTPNGDIVASMLQHGGIIGKSTRGVGEISENNIVDKVYQMIAIDSVVDPSGPNCFVDGIFESKNFLINEHGDIIETAFQKYENGLKSIPVKSVKSTVGREHVEKLFENFLRDINKI